MQLAFEPWGGMGIQFLLPLTTTVIAWLPARRNYVFQLMGVFKSLALRLDVVWLKLNLSNKTEQLHL